MSLSPVDRLKKQMGLVPRVRLACLPTPLVRAKNLGKYLGGLHLLVKREDMTGIALGGNKSRQCEYRLAPALIQHADLIISGGSLNPNNLATQTVAAARRLGLPVHLVFRKDDPQQAYSLQGNRLLEWLMGAEISFMEGTLKEQIKVMHVLSSSLRAQGRHPFLTGLEDSDLAAVAYVECFLELQEQLKSLDNVKPCTFILASGGATAAGLYLAASFLQADVHILSVNPGYYPLPDEPKCSKTQVMRIADQAAMRLKLEVNLDPTLLEVVTLKGKGSNGNRLRAMQIAAQQEGLITDPIYTGAAMELLIRRAQESAFHKNEILIFFHTGGTASLFSYARWLTSLSQ
jgi:1-aminocyclopropane-1-carboxylate deaminase/D-cysteine desulfhydrase-like pyridoxal-dependent ACC family enzyme